MKALILKPGRIKDLSDVLRIARCEGRRLLGVEKVKVHPFCIPYHEGYIVIVEPQGCSKASGVGGWKANK